MSLTINVMRMGLNVVYYSRKLVGDKTVETIAKILRMVSLKKIPSYNKYLPKGAPKIKNPLKLESDLTVVYFPSCINRAMGVSIDYSENEALVEKVLNILQKAKINVVFPEDKEKLCCGMAFNSKGFVEIGDYKAKELEEALLKASNNGEYPILCDMSPCLYRMKETLKKKIAAI
jgi:D-lactate dehydrogenase